MPLTLRVDGDRWRAHMRSVAEAHPGIVPVAKGNGYGFGIGSLARRSAWLGADTLAVGTYEEVPQVLSRFRGDVVVMTPWRPWLGTTGDDRRVIHTLGRLDDLRELAVRQPGARVVVEGVTSMSRHGVPAIDLVVAAGAVDGLRPEGLALHLPMAGDRLAETHEWCSALKGSGLPVTTLFVSHLRDVELRALRQRWPSLLLRPRIGTALWLGDRKALRPVATVLDVHRVTRGQRVGYRHRPVPRAGWLLVISGGTSHGVGLEAPTPGTTLRSRAISVARGSLEAAGFAVSPFSVGGKQRWFVEPPHMQVSMVFLPADEAPPAIGDEVDVNVRFTTTTFDAVLIS